MCPDARVEIGGQLSGVGSLLLARGFWGLNSGCQARWQAPLLTEPSDWPTKLES